MKPGPEMNQLVATKVMGWTLVPDMEDVLNEIDPPRMRIQAKHPSKFPEGMEPPAPLFEAFPLPDYSGNIVDAMQVFNQIGKMRGGPFDLYKPVVRLEWYEWDGIAWCGVGRCKSAQDDEIIVHSGSVWTYFVRSPDGDGGYEQGEENRAMALAICIAALRAVGEEVEIR